MIYRVPFTKKGFTRHQRGVGAGFTIVETLVAVAVLLLIIAAPLTLAERSLASSDAARQGIVAVYLAQEAIEFVRNLRDGNALADIAWLSSLDPCRDARGCGIDPTNPQGAKQIALCGDLNDSCRLWKNAGTALGQEALKGLFGHPQNRTGGENGWVKTEYLRKVFVVEAADGKEAKVTVTIDWTAGGFGARSLTVSTNLMRWYVAL